MSARTPVRRLNLARLVLERLEDRSLLDAGLAGAFAAPDVDWEVSVAVVPNDTRFGDLWGMNNTGQSGGTVDADIDAVEAWDVTTGAAAMAVGVIDTGIDYLHPDLYLNIWINQGEIPSSVRAALTDTDGDGVITFWDLNDPSGVNIGAGKILDVAGISGKIDAADLLASTANGGWADGLNNDNNGYVDDFVGWDFVNNDNNPIDDNNHGTHVAGTIGAIGNNGTGVAGVNWKVRMAALKFLSSSGSGSISNAQRSLEYATANGIKITNNSWGGGGYSSSFETALIAARNAGSVFVAAAGNSGSNNDSTASYPSNYNVANVVAVLATTRTDARASFSSYGATTVDLGAPGEAILSTTRNNTYASFNGTSMATPHVAGAMALVWAREPSLTYDQVIARILNTVDVKPSLSGLVATGGRLNVQKALAAGVPDTSGPRVVSAVVNGTTSASKVTVSFSEAIDPATFTLADVVSFNGPAGAIAVTGVTAVAGSGNTVFDLSFATQTTAGTYSLTIGPDVRDAAGNQMNQNGNGTAGESPGDRYTATFALQSSTVTTFTSTTPVAIRDWRTSSSSISVGPNLTVSDLNVRVKITHTWVGDLRVYLRGPGGQTINLSLYRGGSGDNFNDTVFDDEAGTAIGNGTAPFSGTYRPEAALSTFDGALAQGTWTLFVYDAYWGDVGTLNGWSLIVQSGAGPTDLLSDVGPAAEAAPAAIDKGGPEVGSSGDPLRALAASLVEQRLATGSFESPARAEVEEAAEVAAISADQRRQDSARQASLDTEDEEEREGDLFAELERDLAVEV